MGMSQGSHTIQGFAARVWGGRSCALAVVAIAGCGAGDAPRDRFTPTTEVARSVLQASLDDWRAGHLRGPVRLGAPRIEVSDSYRRSERSLRAFEILGPVGVDERPCFAVRLTLDNPGEDQVVRYLVVGHDPYWVFRWEDYERISHWEHKMEDDEASETPP
jgi:hypothetical protein